ncbi:MAG: antibiotic biosynthesis monooxygenase [Planctomycetes bacterium]|nr:antibiotic biosynthesis monooxygenase [Planctomycetota bacterium]
MIHVIAKVQLRAGRRSAFLDVFRELVPEVRAESGCIEYGPAIDVATGISGQIPNRDDVVLVIEKWRDLAALRDHLNAPHMLAYRERMKELDHVESVALEILEPASP